MGIPLEEAALLGAVQGIAGTLPVSGDGHLALASLFLGHAPAAATSAVLHAGTLAATVVFFRRRARRALEEGVRGLVHPALWRETSGGRDASVVALATIPTALVGVALAPGVATWAASPTVIGAGLLASAIAVGAAAWAPRGDREVPSTFGALAVGLAQGAAVLPGLDRTAMALASLLWLGVRPERAFELAFLVGIPALVFGASESAVHAAFDAADAVPLAFAAALAFGAGLGALALLRAVVLRARLAAFAVYLAPLAVATLAWGYARP